MRFCTPLLSAAWKPPARVIMATLLPPGSRLLPTRSMARRASLLLPTPELGDVTRSAVAWLPLATPTVSPSARPAMAVPSPVLSTRSSLSLPAVIWLASSWWLARIPVLSTAMSTPSPVYGPPAPPACPYRYSRCQGRVPSGAWAAVISVPAVSAFSLLGERRRNLWDVRRRTLDPKRMGPAPARGAALSCTLRSRLCTAPHRPLLRSRTSSALSAASKASTHDMGVMVTPPKVRKISRSTRLLNAADASMPTT
mmetsp:Transcript_64100/g.164947  ORF Transcript_64100/g.164947 Transcript_64100/m.164947 type:complete len:254 (+) Transcript_64100:1234-1995(+)